MATPTSVESKPSLLAKSAAGAKYLILLQLFSKVLTFAVNQLLLRYLSPELLGISTQLETYSISVLFFAREALRVAVQRQNDPAGEAKVPSTGRKASKGTGDQVEATTASRDTQALVNLAYISICLGFAFAAFLGGLYLQSLQSRPTVLAVPYFKVALRLYAAATLCELFAEPCFVVVQQRSEYRIRASAEAIATVLRTVVTCGSAILAAIKGIDVGVLPFALGQSVYGLSILLVYYGRVLGVAARGKFRLIPTPILASQKSDYISRYLPRPVLTLAMSLFAQGIFKHLLTQGDVILISYLASEQAQGVYALASNYGGLVARVVFQPVEEACRNYFGKQLSSAGGQPSKAAVSTASSNLHSILKFYVLFSISALSLGPTIAPLLLSIVAGPRWTASGAAEVLARYCYYIPVLAINGVTEAFISAVASESELHRQSAWMLVFSIGFATAGYIFLRTFELGAQGLVWANVINMAFRIIWSGDFIRKYLARNGGQLSIMSMMPKSATIAVGAGTAAVLAQMHGRFKGGIEDLFIVGLVAGLHVTLL
ncbi:MAG: Oligosaccharide translocation protein rft1 [Claussenomyces sp. TS43310]|nr:MAG: Oligosaccharide translocation protein rft1 [Claussenomyces sp. TS43310]